MYVAAGVVGASLSAIFGILQGAALGTMRCRRGCFRLLGT